MNFCVELKYMMSSLCSTSMNVSSAGVEARTEVLEQCELDNLGSEFPMYKSA